MMNENSGHLRLSTMVMGVMLAFATLACGYASAQAAATPFDSAVCAWNMGGAKDSAGANSELKVDGDVALGVELSEAEREASLQRGGDGQVAEFRGGYLSAGQGADSELNLTGKAMTMCLRVRLGSDVRDTPLFSKYGGHEALVYNLFCTDLGAGPAFGFELGADANEKPLCVSIPLAKVGATDWHDVIVRFTGPKLELFVDGVLVDEDWPMGALRQGNVEPCLIGAQSVSGHVKSGFHGWIDHAALWDRALTDEEVVTLSGGPGVIAKRDVEILGPEVGSMQYWRPRGGGSVGDCMPFFHDGRFHLFYLFDRRHHGSKWGLGAHQWAHASTTDLVHWEHHPIAIPITEQWEGSICTGSVFFHDGVYFAHYAVRMPDCKQHLARATSTDGIHFEKSPEFPMASPQEGYDPMQYRDPLVFEDAAGLFHMLVTARLTDGRDGCLAQLTSKDLKTWALVDPFIIPGRVTDCPDYFEWNGWHYLFAEFVYWTSRDPFGPWTSPPMDKLDVLYVPKTAPFTGGRRIYVSWLPDGGWGGNAVFRELIQRDDGTLGTKFPPEMIPASGEPSALTLSSASEGVSIIGKTVTFNAAETFRSGVFSNLPRNIHITLRVNPTPSALCFGLGVRAHDVRDDSVPAYALTGDDRDMKACELRFRPADQLVEFGSPTDRDRAKGPAAEITHVTGLDKPFTVDLIMKDDIDGNGDCIVDACIDDQRTIITRYDGTGDKVFLFVTGGAVTFEDVEIRPLTE